MELTNSNCPTFVERAANFINWLCNPWRQQHTVNAAVAIQSTLSSFEVEDDLDDVNECLEETRAGQSQRTKAVVAGNFTPVESKRNRRIRKKGKLKFVKYLVNEARAEFGLPRPTDANRLMVVHFLNGKCKEWGLVTSHTVSSVALAVPLVFVPMESDILGHALLGTHATQAAVGAMGNTQGEGWWNNQLGIGARAGLAFRAK